MDGGKRKKKNHGPIIDGFYKYRDELIAAVEYLMSRGITRTSEIAKRLNVSPFTVRNIKIILRRRRMRMQQSKQQPQQQTPQQTTQQKVEPEPKQKKRDILEEILGI